MKFIKYNVLAKSQSLQEFSQHIGDLGLTMEYKKGIPVGVRDFDNKLYTWKKIDITSKDFQMLEQREQMQKLHNRVDRLEALQHMRKVQNMEKQKSKEREC